VLGAGKPQMVNQTLKTTTPAGGGGPAGVVLGVDPREEVKIDHIRHRRGGGRLWRNLFRVL